ncbi:MAG: hypothetical protein ACMG50_06345, partial [Thermomonas sp.]
MKTFWLPLLIALGLAACTKNVQEAQLTNIPIAKKPLVPTTEVACTEAGQFWAQQGLPGGSKSCAVKTT